MHAVVAGWLLGASPFSGADRRLLALLREAPPLLRDGERLTVLHHASLPLPAPNRRDPVEWRPVDIPQAPTWRRAIAEQRRLRPLLRELGATVYDHGFLPAPRVGVPQCLTIHDVRDADGEGPRPGWLARPALRVSLRRAARVIAVSRWTAERLRSLAPGCAPRVVGNGVAVPPPGPRLDDLPERGFVLHVGHLEPRKNLAVLVRALAALDASRRPELWLVGKDAGEWPRLRALAAQLSVGQHVKHLGVQPDEALHAFYRSARLVVLPSRYEGFGLPALEARAHGARVAVSDRGALPEVVGDGAVLPADQPAAWAAAMDAPRDEPAGAVARRIAAASASSWSAAAQQWLEVLRSVSASPS